MTEEEKSKVFQPFHAGFKKGVGLGMAIVYQIMQQHNGRIEIESHRGKGTIVSMCFPAIDYTGQDSPTPGRPASVPSLK